MLTALLLLLGSQEIGNLLQPGNSTSLSDCCVECAQTAGCRLFQFLSATDIGRIGTRGRVAPAGFADGTQCYLLTGGNDFTDLQTYGLPTSGTHSAQRRSRVIPSWVGGLCNPAPEVVDDPHFVGAQGTRFDFNGVLNKPFCLITDKDFHINVLLKGYQDDTAEKGLRSWIKEVGLLWTANGKTHRAHLVARDGKQTARGDGFMSRLALDNAEVAVPAKEGEVVKAKGFSMRFVGVEQRGPYDVEHYLVQIGGVATLNLRMRAAHKKLQTAEDAEVHFNIEVTELQQTPKVHGVLGQTFRNTQAQMKKALRFSELALLLHSPVRADGETGKGFLDGQVGDYESTSVLSPDCRFSSYQTM